MPRLKKKSYEVRRKQTKLHRKKIREERIKKLQELQMINQTDIIEESSLVGKKVLSEEMLNIKSEKDRRNEYVRNYRRNMPEEKKKVLREATARRQAQMRKNMSEERKAAIRLADRLRTALKRKNMSEEEKLAQREYYRQKVALKRKNMTEEQKLVAREADRRRVALKRKKSQGESDDFDAAMLSLALHRNRKRTRRN